MKKLSTTIIWILMVIYMLFPTQAISKEIGIGNLPPKLIIESYDIQPKQLIPGEDFCIKLNIKNTNPEVAAENILLTYTSSDNSIYPVYGTPNQFYISSIAGEETKQAWIYMKVSNLLKSEVISLNFTLDYSSVISNITCNSSVILPISSNCKMIINSISVAKDANVQSKALVNVVFMNTGLVDIKNITMRLKGDILDEQKQIVFGDLEAGGQLVKDYYVNFQNEGTQQLGVSFTYENKEGIVFEVPESTYTTLVGPAIEKNSVDDRSVDKALDNNKVYLGLNIWQWIFLIISIILIILIVTKVYKRLNKKTKI